jgi:uncharacterized protein (DUF1501 family)
LPELTRRRLLQDALAAGAGLMAGSGSLLARTARAAPAGDRVLVVAFLRGGADGLSLCAPYGEPEYYALRPTIALPRPRQQARESLVDLDGHFGLHPDLAPLKPLWSDGRFAVLHAVGCPDTSRSHFDAQEFLESGTPGNKGTGTGWLERCLAHKGRRKLTAGVAFSAFLPRSFCGGEPVLVARDLTRLDFEAAGWREEAERDLRRLYAQDQSAVGEVGLAALDEVAILKRTRQLKDGPENGAVYPEGFVGEAFRQAACVIKSDLPTSCVFIDVAGDFDTHANQLDANRRDYHSLAVALSSFDRDLGRAMDRVVVMVVTEFGRAVAESGSAGTDHGSGGAMLLLGAPVRGGRVHGRWPGLAKDRLFEERDLAVATDFRDVFAEVARKHLGIKDARSLFPGYVPGAEPGVLA